MADEKEVAECEWGRLAIGLGSPGAFRKVTDQRQGQS